MTAAGQRAVIIPPRFGTAPREILHCSQAAAGPAACSHVRACTHQRHAAPPLRLEGDGSGRWEVTVDSGGPPTRTRTPPERAQSFWQGNNEPVVDLWLGWEGGERKIIIGRSLNKVAAFEGP